ncbi:LIRP-like isoform X1 [Osmia bicornis bicornis]|uniref:LIRP-like isoform X1 n=2 Tax=Osmia bicornis bicornis TaxID=1437191 RepID=UPI001EAF6282|nr:LIRP-like isoform X1 [Osmia bicornis bicornis]XP_046143603.1 LIRP-like isoform X1 [Osmia bicornis bicornis]
MMFAYRLHTLMCLTIVITILMPETEHARSDVFQERQKRQTVTEPRQYCGQSLPENLHMICAGNYNSRFKKSNQEMETDDYAFNYDVHPYKSIKNARKMLRFRRYTKGIHEECCVKSCSTEELRTYCGTFN